MAVDLRFITSVMKANNDLERVADLATDLAEGVVYMVEGKIIRHQHDVYEPPEPGDA